MEGAASPAVASPTSLERFAELVQQMVTDQLAANDAFIHNTGTTQYTPLSADQKATLMEPIANACNEAFFELERFVNIKKQRQLQQRSKGSNSDNTVLR